MFLPAGAAFRQVQQSGNLCRYLFLLGQKSAYSPHRGDSLHRFVKAKKTLVRLVDSMRVSGSRPCPPAKTECLLAGSGTVGLTDSDQWASKKQLVDRFKILILLQINCGLRYNKAVFFCSSCSTGYGISDQKAVGDCSGLSC